MVTFFLARRNIKHDMKILRALKVHDMFPEPEFRKPKSQTNDDDFLMQLAREMSWFITYDSYCMTRNFIMKTAESKLTITAEEIYIFLKTKKLYFGQIIKAILMHLQDTKFIFAHVKCCVIFSLIARRWFFSNEYQQSFAFGNSSSLFWLDQGLRSTSGNKV